MPKIYDCFTFFNEMDLLEIRLNELDEVVDYFVIVESTRTFQKNSKPLYLNLDDNRINKFKNKIIHIIVDDFPNFFTHWRIPKVWDYEKHQRNAISRGLSNADLNDIVIISDVDEIPCSSKITDNINLDEPIVFQQRFFYYFLNYAITKAEPESCLEFKNGLVYWKGSVMFPKYLFTNAQNMRNLRNNPNTKQINEGGWHFSYIGGIDAIISKLKSFSHANEAKQILQDLDDKEKISQVIASGSDLFDRNMSFKTLPLTEPFPKYIINNLKKFQKLLCNINETYN
jgi:beta-1,4-mannosyl-glycoprotein beta-1,4-N-acetylglucosaminyltransferase